MYELFIRAKFFCKYSSEMMMTLELSGTITLYCISRSSSFELSFVAAYFEHSLNKVSYATSAYASDYRSGGLYSARQGSRCNIRTHGNHLLSALVA